jgi:hypothetical protein
MGISHIFLNMFLWFSQYQEPLFNIFLCTFFFSYIWFPMIFSLFFVAFPSRYLKKRQAPRAVLQGAGAGTTPGGASGDSSWDA